MTTMRSNVEFTETTSAILERWRAINWDLRDIINIGIVLFDQAKSDVRDAARVIAYLPPGENLATMPEEDFRQRVLAIVRETQAIPAKTERGRRAKSAKSG